MSEMFFTWYSAQRSDLARLLKMESDCFPNDPWGETALTAMMNEESTYFLIWQVLSEGSKISRKFGYVVFRVTDDETELYKIAVLPKFRGKGYANTMLHQMIHIAGRDGSKRVILEVRESNAAALALYQKNGFTVDGIRKNYYKNPTEDAILMSLDLN